MFIREFSYTGYDGQPKTDTYAFNLTEAELFEIDLSSVKGFTAEMKDLLKKERTKEIVEAFKSIILGAVGEISADGRKFVKNDEIREDFYRSKAYSMLFVELVSSGEKVAEFLRGAIPEEIRQKMDEADSAKAAETKADEAKAPVESPDNIMALPNVPGRSDLK